MNTNIMQKITEPIKQIENIRKMDPVEYIKHVSKLTQRGEK